MSIIGKNCEYNINECESTPCKNNGWCIDEVNSYKCVCQYGNTGPHCEENIDFCDPNYCMNNATCRSLDDMFVCECTQGLSGIWCEIDIDECAEDPCVNGKCLNTYGGFICECEKGFSGSLCQEEIDECLVDKYPCQNAGICVDLIGDFICECMQGFTGRRCETDVDECEVDPCGRGRCINTFGGFICECDIGYGGSLCKEEINECLVNKFPCLNFGTCVDLLGSFRCDCIPGFTGSLCDMNINECDSKPCENGGVCIDMINDFRCDCPDKFKGPLCQTEKDTLSSTATISTEMFDFTKSSYAKTTISHVDINTTTAEFINTTDPHGIRNYTYHDSSSIDLANTTSEHTTVKNLTTSSMGSTQSAKIRNQTILASFVTQSSEMKNVTVIATVANITFKEDNVTHPLPFTSLPLAENTETSLATSTDTTTVYSHKPVDSVKENITTIAPTIAYSSSFVTQTTNPVTTKFDRITSTERLTVTKTAIANISTTESMITTFDQMPSIHSTTMSPKRVYLPSTSRVINDTTKDTESLTVTQPFGTFETSTTVDLTQADTSMRDDSSGEREILSSGDHFLISSGDQRGSGEDITLFTSHDASGEDVDKLTFIKDSSSGDDIPASQNKEEISMYSASREEDMQITEITEYRFDHSGEEEIPLSGDQMFVSSGDKTVIKEYETDTFVSTTSGDEALSISDSEDLSEYSSGDTGISSSGDTVLPSSADQNVTREHETEHNVSTASGDIDITSSGSEDLAEYSSGDAGISSSGDQISPSSVGQNETSKHEIDPFVPTTSGDRDITSSGSEEQSEYSSGDAGLYSSGDQILPSLAGQNETTKLEMDPFLPTASGDIDITSSGSEELSEYSSGDAGLYSSGDQILPSSAGQNETTKLKMDPMVPTASGEIDITSSGSEDLAEYSSGDTGISSSGDLVLPSSADQNETSKYVIDLLVISASGEVDITSSGSEDLSEYSSGDAEISSSGDRVLPTSVESDISEYETQSVVFTASGDVDFTSSGSGDLYEYSSGEKEISSSGAQVLSSGDQKEKSKHETFFIHSESLEDDEIALGYMDYLGTSKRTNIDYSTTPETLTSYISIEQSILSGDGELFYKNNTDHHESTSSADGDLSSSGSEGVSEYSTGDIEISSSGDQLFSSSGDQNVIKEHETVTFVSTASGVEDLSSSGSEGLSEYSSSGVEISSSGDQLFSSSGDQNVISEHETVTLISTVPGDVDLSSSGSEAVSEYSTGDIEISSSGDQLFSSSGDQNVIKEHETVTFVSTASGVEDLSSSGSEGVSEYSSSGVEISSSGDQLFSSSGDQNVISEHETVTLISTVPGDVDLSSSGSEGVLESSSSGIEISSPGDLIFPSSGDQNELSQHVTGPLVSTASGDKDLSSSSGESVLEYSSGDKEISSSGDQIFPSSGDQNEVSKHVTVPLVSTASGDGDLSSSGSDGVLEYSSSDIEISSPGDHIFPSSGDQNEVSKHVTGPLVSTASGDGDLSSSGSDGELEYSSGDIEISSSGDQMFPSSGDQNVISEHETVTLISTASADEDLSSSGSDGVLEYSSGDIEISSSGDHIFPSSGDQNVISEHETVTRVSTASADEDLSSSGSDGVLEYSSGEISSSRDEIFPSSGDQSVLKEFEADSIITSASGDNAIVDRDSKDVLKYSSGESEIWSSAEHVIFSSGEQTTLSEDDMILQKHETSGEMEISSGFENHLSKSTHTARKLDFTSLVTAKSIFSSGELSISTSPGDGDLVSSALYHAVIPTDDLETPANNKTIPLSSTPLPVNESVKFLESSGDSLPEIPAYESSGGGIQPVELDSLDYQGVISSGDAMKVIDDHTSISIEQSLITQHAILNVNTTTLRSITPNKSRETTGDPPHQYNTITEEPGSKTTPVSGKYLIWVEVNDTVPGDNQKSFINYTEYNIISPGDRDELSLPVNSKNDYDDLLKKNVNQTNLKTSESLSFKSKDDAKEDTVDWESSGNIVPTTDSTADIFKPSSHPILLSTQHATDVHESVDKTSVSEKFIDGSGEYNTSDDISSSGDDIPKDTHEIDTKREISVISDYKLTSTPVNATAAFVETSQTTIQEPFTKRSGPTYLPNTATEMQVPVAEHQIPNMSLFNTTIKWTNITADSNMDEANTSAIILTDRSFDDDSLKRIHSPTKGLITVTHHKSSTPELVTKTHLMSSTNFVKKSIYRPNNPWLFASKHLHQKGKQGFKPSNPWLAARMHLQKIHQKKKKHKDSQLPDKTHVASTPVSSVLQQITEIITDKSKSPIYPDVSPIDTSIYTSESSERTTNTTKHYNASLFTSSASSMSPTTDHTFPDILAVNDSAFKSVSAGPGFEIPSVTTTLHPSTDTQTTSLASTLTTDFAPISKMLETKSMKNITDIPKVVPSAKHTILALQIETTQSKQSSEASTHAQPSILDLHSTKPVTSKTVTKEHKSAESLETSRDISDVVTPRKYETTLGLKTKTYIERNETILSQSLSTPPPPPIIPTLIVYYPTEDQSGVSFSSKVETKQQQRTDSSPEIDTLPDVTYPSTSVTTVSTLNNTNLTAEWLNEKTQTPATSEHTKLKTTGPVNLPTNLSSLSEPPSSFTVSHDSKFTSSTPISFLNTTSAASFLTLPNVTSSISSCGNLTKSNESQICIKTEQESKLRNFTDSANLIYSLGPVSTDLSTPAVAQITTLPAVTTSVQTQKSTAPLTSVKTTKPETTINLKEGKNSVSSLPESELPRTEAKQTFFRTSQHVFQSHSSSPISFSTSFATPDTASVVLFNKTHANTTTGNISVILDSTTAASNYSTVFTDLKQSTPNIKQTLVTDMTKSTLGQIVLTPDAKCTKWKQIWGRFKICIQHGQLLSTKEANTETFSIIKKDFITSTMDNINESRTEREVTMKSSAFVLTNDTSSPAFTFRPTSTLQSSIPSTQTTPLWQSQRNFTFNYIEASSVKQLTDQSPEITTSKYLPGKHTLLVTQPSNFTHTVTLQPINLTSIHDTMSKTPVFQSTSMFTKIKSIETSFITDTTSISSRHKTAEPSTSSLFTRTTFTTTPTYTMPTNISTMATQTASPIRSHNETSFRPKTPYTSYLTISNLIPRSIFVSSTNITKSSAIETSTSPTPFTSQSLLPVSSSRAKTTHSSENPNILRINTTDLMTPTEPITVAIPRMDLSQEPALTPNITFSKNMKSTTDPSALTLAPETNKTTNIHLVNTGTSAKLPHFTTTHLSPLPDFTSKFLNLEVTPTISTDRTVKSEVYEKSTALVSPDTRFTASPWSSPANLTVIPVTDRTSSTDTSIKTTTTSPFTASSVVPFSQHSTTNSIIVTNRILSMGKTTTINTTSPAINTKSPIPTKLSTGFPTTGTVNTVGTFTTKPGIGVNPDIVSVPMEIRMNASAATTFLNLTINNKTTQYTNILTLDTSTKMVKSSTVLPTMSSNPSIGTSEPSRMLSIPTESYASTSSNMPFTNKYDHITPLNIHSKSFTKLLTSTDQTLPSKEVFSRTHLQFTSTSVPLSFPKENDWAANITMKLQTFPLQTIKMRSAGLTSYKTTTKPKLQLITLLTKGVNRTVASENLIQVTNSESVPTTSVKQLQRISTMSVEPLSSTSTTSEEQPPSIPTTTVQKLPSISTTKAHQSPSISTTIAQQLPSKSTTPAEQSLIVSTTSVEQSSSTLTTSNKPSLSSSVTSEKQLPNISTTAEHKLPRISTALLESLLSISTTADKPSLRVSTMSDKSSLSISTTSDKPSLRVSTTSDKTSLSVSITSDKPSLRFSTTTMKPSPSISTTSMEPLQNISTKSIEHLSSTRKLSVIRHIVDLTSNNTYPHPRKEVSEYIRNTTIVKKKAVLTFKLIKVTVVRTVSQVAESGRKIVLQSYRRVKDIATTLTVTTYSRAKQLLKKALNRVGALWKYCKTGINHFVVKPLLNARVFVKHRFHRAYARLGELFQRGRQIFDTTIDTFKDETASYFENLANYYTGVYTQYTSEVKDIFESLKIPDSDPS